MTHRNGYWSYCLMNQMLFIDLFFEVQKKVKKFIKNSYRGDFEEEQSGL